jgi:hypothetical protein
MIELLDDDDWRQAFGYAGEPNTDARFHKLKIATAIGSTCSAAPFTREDVIHIEHATPGENNGPPWRICGLLADGRWFYLEAGCDYTGWDCQAGGSTTLADSRDALIQFALTQEARALWGL